MKRIIKYVKLKYYLHYQLKETIKSWKESLKGGKVVINKEIFVYCNQNIILVWNSTFNCIFKYIKISFLTAFYGNQSPGTEGGELKKKIEVEKKYIVFFLIS